MHACWCGPRTRTACAPHELHSWLVRCLWTWKSTRNDNEPQPLPFSTIIHNPIGCQTGEGERVDSFAFGVLPCLLVSLVFHPLSSPSIESQSSDWLTCDLQPDQENTEK